MVTVRPPATVLERMLALRIHLDDRDADSGALRVIPGSHRLPAEATRPETPEPELCVASSGDALLMRRLLWHTSAQTTTPTRRRVIHFEFADAELTPPLAWFEQLRP